MLAADWEHSITLYGFARNSLSSCEHICQIINMRVSTRRRPMPGVCCLPMHPYAPCTHSENAYNAIRTELSISHVLYVRCPGPRPLLVPDLTASHTSAVPGVSLRPNSDDQRQPDVADTRGLTAIHLAVNVVTTAASTSRHQAHQQHQASSSKHGFLLIYPATITT